MVSFTSLKLIIANIPISQQHSTYRSNADSQILTTSCIASPKSLNLYSRKGLTLQRHSPRPTLVASAQSNFLRILRTVWKVGKDGIEAGTGFVPASIPKPIARIGVAGVLLSVSLFVLKSFLSTAFFVMVGRGTGPAILLVCVLRIVGFLMELLGAFRPSCLWGAVWNCLEQL